MNLDADTDTDTDTDSDVDDEMHDAVKDPTRAIKENDHNAIRDVLAANAGLKWDTRYETICECCAFRTRLRASQALGNSSVELATVLLLADAGFIGPGCAGALFDILAGCEFHKQVAHNFMALVERFDTAELTATRSTHDETLLQCSLCIAASHQELRAPYIAWMNRMLCAGMRLVDANVLALARASLTYHEGGGGSAVVDDMPELCLDAALFTRWRRRYYDHAHKTMAWSRCQEYSDTPDAPLAARCASIKAFLDRFPYEQEPHDADNSE